MTYSTLISDPILGGGASCGASSISGWCVLQDAPVRGGGASPSPLPPVRGEGETGDAPPRTEGWCESRTTHHAPRTTPGLVLYVASNLASFQVAPDPDLGRVIYGKDLTWDGFPYRRLDGHWLSWLAARVAKAGDRLSAAQRQAWTGIAEWASLHGIRPSPPPYGYLPPAAFTTPGRWDEERTDRCPPPR